MIGPTFTNEHSLTSELQAHGIALWTGDGIASGADESEFEAAFAVLPASDTIRADARENAEYI